jgi:hypothetical protein
MTNSHALSLVVALSILTGCLSDDGPDQIELDAGAGAAPSCDVSPALAEARRLCVDHCDAATAADGCTDRDLYAFEVACRELCVAIEVPEDCVDEAARDWVCLSQVEWTCAEGAEKPAPPADACAITGSALAACVKGGS